MWHEQVASAHAITDQLAIMAAAAIGRSRRLPELFDSTSDEDSGSKRKKRRRSSRRKAAEARTKIQESARRDQSSDDSDDELQPGAGSPSSTLSL